MHEKALQDYRKVCGM